MSNLSAQEEAGYIEEIEALRRQLSEAKAIIEALLAGESDAVAPPDTPLMLLQKTQQALQESEQTFRAAFEGATDAMIVADDAGRYLQVNPAASELFGIPETELLGKTAADFAPPDFDFTAAWQAFQESGQETGEFQLLRPDGSVRVAEYSAVTDFLPGRHLSILRDVTERKQLEKDRERALYELGERVKEATLLHRAGRILSEHGKSIREILEAIVALIPPAWQYPSITAARITFGQMAVTTPNFAETRWRQLAAFHTGEGTAGKVEVYYLEARPEADEGPFLGEERDTLEALASMLQSNVERRQAEEALRRSEEQYRTLFETMAQGVIYHDSQGRIVAANPAASRIFGRPREEIASLTPDRLPPLLDEAGNRLSPEELPHRAALRTGQPVRDMTIGFFRREEDDYRWVKAHTIPQFRQGESEPYRAFTTFEDITERKRKENEIREREAMLARTERVANIGSWEWEIATDTVTWSEELFRIFGRDPEQRAPSFAEHSQIFPPEDLARLQTAVERAVAQGTPYKIELRTRRSDGEIRHCVARGYPERGLDGRVTDLYGSFQDITERKAAEEALRRSEARYRLLFETMSQGVIYQNTQGQIVDANLAAEQILGRSFDQIMGASSLDTGWLTIHEDGTPFPGRELPARVALRTGEPVRAVLVGVFNPEDGEHRWLRVTALPQPPVRDGEPAGVYEIFEDVTEQKQAEDALRRSEARYRSLFERMTQGVVYQNAEGEIVDANPAAERILGRTLAQMQGRTSADPRWHTVRWDGSPFPGEEHPAMVALQTGEMVEDVRMGVYNPAEDGYRWLRVDAVPKFREGKDEPYRVFSTFEDVTNQVREEEQRNRLASIVESSEDAVFDTDLDATVTSWNPGAEQLSGYTATEIVGQPAASLLPSEQQEQIAEILETVAGGQPVRNRELVVRRKDGTLFTVSLNATPVRGHQDRVRRVAIIARDVTRRKQREQRLRFQAQLLENVREAVVATDLERRVTFWGPGATTLFGHQREEALGEDFRELVPFLPPIPDGVLAEHLLAEGSWRGRTRHRRKDGQTIDLDTSLGLIRTESGEPSGFLGILWDVTEQVTYEHELAAVANLGRALRDAQGAEETYRITLEQLEQTFAPDGVALALLDPDGKLAIIRAASGRWQGQEGLRLVADEGPTARVLATDEVFLTEDLAAEKAFRLPHLLPEQTAAAALPLFMESKPFGILWMTRPAPFTGREKRVLGATGSLIAGAVHRARLYERLREQASQLQRIMESVDWGLLLLDEELRIVLANDAASTYLSLLVEETLSADLEGYQLRQLGDQPLSRLLAPAAAGASKKSTLISVSEHDREFSIMVDPLEGTAGWVLVLRDVTEERRVQEQLAQQDRLASVGQLAAGIAHDFNNAISAIVLYSQIMQRDRGMEPRNRERLDVIFSQAQHATNLVGQILDFSRRSVMERAAADLVPLFKEWYKLWQRTLPENIHIDFRSAADSFIVNADPTRLQQAVMNIVINARDAMPEGGRLTVELNFLRLQRGSQPPLPGMAPGAWVAIAISDTGMGIEEKLRSHIFDPFFTTKGRGEGTGLGLAQAHGIIQQHEGHIAVRSQMGKGSTFTIYLPLLLQEGAVRSLPALPETQPFTTGESTILVVEDQAETRLAIKEALEVLDYRVMDAGGGLEALQILDRHKGGVDLVLTDMVMRDIGGLELIARMQERYAGVKALLMTGYPLDEESRSRLGEGQVAWLQKPFVVGELIEKVEQVLQRGDG